MAFILNIATDNAAFGEDDDYDKAQEIARILRELADKISDDSSQLASGTVRDSNGNRVGDWTVE